MGGSAFALRAATADDAPAIAAIYAEHVAHGTASFELQPPDAAEMRTRMTTLLAGGFPWIVAESAGEVVGYAYAGPYRPRRAYRFTVEDSVYLKPAAQGRGIGKMLLERFAEEAKGRGAARLHLEVREGNHALSLYERSDYVLVGRRRNYYNGRAGQTYDALTLAKNAAS